MSINRVILIGNVGKDPEQKPLPNGGLVVNINIATSEHWKDKNTGKPHEKNEWHRIVFFDRLAEIAAQYVRKGSKLYIEGALKTRSWEQDGVTKYITEVIGSKMQMLDSRDDDGTTYAGERSQIAQNTQQPKRFAPQHNRHIEDDGGDLPF